MGEIKDGTYTVDVTLTGGSGRASVKSPARLMAEKGGLKAEIEWDSPYYDYMEVEGNEYYPVNADGNSVFIIDAELDRELPIKAETVAMSEPHLIDYTLYLDSGTLHREGASALPFVIAGAALAAIVAFILLRKRKRHEK